MDTARNPAFRVCFASFPPSLPPSLIQCLQAGRDSSDHTGSASTWSKIHPILIFLPSVFGSSVKDFGLLSSCVLQHSSFLLLVNKVEQLWCSGSFSEGFHLRTAFRGLSPVVERLRYRSLVDHMVSQGFCTSNNSKVMSLCNNLQLFVICFHPEIKKWRIVLCWFWFVTEHNCLFCLFCYKDFVHRLKHLQVNRPVPKETLC